jgi:hypothetical protein
VMAHGRRSIASPGNLVRCCRPQPSCLHAGLATACCAARAIHPATRAQHLAFLSCRISVACACSRHGPTNNAAHAAVYGGISSRGQAQREQQQHGAPVAARGRQPGSRSSSRMQRGGRCVLVCAVYGALTVGGTLHIVVVSRSSTSTPCVPPILANG